jgi:lactoylglutathione lyase
MIDNHAPRLLHAMLRVRDLPRMLAFYCEVLGMREIRRIEMPELRRTLVFAGYGSNPAEAQVEFWHDWDQAGSAAPAARDGHETHLGIGVRDIHGCVRALAARGVRITREPAPIRAGGRVIAMLEDPEGHEVELLAAD